MYQQRSYEIQPLNNIILCYLLPIIQVLKKYNYYHTSFKNIIYTLN